MDNKIFLANYCQFIETKLTKHVTISACWDVSWCPGEGGGVTDRLHVGGGVGAAVAHDGAATLAAPVPVRAATSRGRRRAGLTSWESKK